MHCYNNYSLHLPVVQLLSSFTSEQCATRHSNTAITVFLYFSHAFFNSSLFKETVYEISSDPLIKDCMYNFINIKISKYQKELSICH